MRELLRDGANPESLQRAFELGVDFRTTERIAWRGRVYPADTLMSSRDLFDEPLHGRYGWIIIEHDDGKTSCRIVLDIQNAYEDFFEGEIKGVKACKESDICREAARAQGILDKFIGEEVDF